MTGGEASVRKGMERTRLREPALGQDESARPVDPVFLASTAEATPPMPDHSFPEFAEAVEVPRYRVVVEVALHDRFETLAGLAHRIVHTLTELLLNLPQLRPHAFADRLAPHRKLPYPILPADVRESRPGGFHLEPLAEPDVNLSAHPAPIKQTLRSYRYPSVRREPCVPWQAVAATGSHGPYGL